MVLCHFVSLVPIRQPRLADVPLWATSKDFLEVSCGPPWQHAHLLAGFLLHEGVDCYVVCGPGRHGALHLILFSSHRSRLQRLHAATAACRAHPSVGTGNGEKPARWSRWHHVDGYIVWN